MALLSLGAVQGSGANDTVAYTIGEAYGLGSEQRLYTETHCVSGDALERVVNYRDAGGRLIAQKTLDYQTGLATPSYVQRNFYAGESITVAVRQDSVDMTVSDGTGAGEVVSARPDVHTPLVVDAGFDAFVRDNWDVLAGGETLRFQFPFAARESLFTLRINPAQCRYATATDKCFRLELDNWILRALLDPIELGYDDSLKRLTRYRGLSNIGDGKGAGQVVDIRFRYEGLPAVACETGAAATALRSDISSPMEKL